MNDNDLNKIDDYDAVLKEYMGQLAARQHQSLENVKRLTSEITADIMAAQRRRQRSMALSVATIFAIVVLLIYLLP